MLRLVWLTHVVGPETAHPNIEALHATHADCRRVDFKGVEEPTEVKAIEAQCG